jgi:hypothetical protein
MARKKYFMIDIPEEFQDLPMPRREWLAGFCVTDKILFTRQMNCMKINLSFFAQSADF